MKNLYLFVFLCISTITLSAQSLVHYWHFNSVSGIIETVPADFYSSAEAPLLIYEAAYPNVVNAGYMDDVAGSDINSRLAEPAGNGIRPRNPSDSMHLIIELPSTGFENLHLSYAARRSGSGMLKQVLYYTTDGQNYLQHGDTVLVTTNYELVTFDFAGLANVDNNPDFGIKILFYEQNVASNGNNRIDNIALEGDPMAASDDVIHYWHFNMASGIFDSIAADLFTGPQAPYIIYETAFPIVSNPGYMDQVAGTSVNSRFENPAGSGIRPRNPSDSMQLVMQLPSIGYQHLKLSYATQRSGSGMLKQVLYYTTDGENYMQHGDTVFVTTDYELANFDFTGLADVDDNPNFGIKILFYEQNVASNGNNRLDNVVFEGVALSNQVTGVIVSPTSLSLLAGETAQLTATVIPTSASNQQVIWESTNENVASVNEQGLVAANSPGITAIIATTIDGGFSDTSMVDVSVLYNLTIAVSGLGSPIENAEVSVNGQNEMTDADGLAEFMLTQGNYTINIYAEQFFSESMDLELTSDTTLGFSLTPSEKILVHYWHFNDLPTGIIESDRVPADMSLSSATVPEIIYQGPGEGYLDDYSPGTAIGAKQSTPAGKALRVRNPSDERELIIQLPTFNCENIELSYAVHRSGSGMLINHLEYTIDGENFINDGLIPNQINVTEQYELHVFDFSDIAGVNDNSKFAVRITYEGNTMQSNGNNRYDNVAMIANLISSTDNILQNNAFSLFPNPSMGIVNILLDDPINGGTFSIFNMQGQLVQQGALIGNETIYVNEKLTNGMYIFQVNLDGARSNRLFMLAR